MQELSNSIKRPNLQIISTDKGEEVQAKRTPKIFNKIIAEKFPNHEKDLSIQIKEASRTPTDLIKIEF
jgi:hypothetical protein